MSPAILISTFLFETGLLWSARLKYSVQTYQLYMDNFRSSMQCIQLTIYHFCILDLCVTWLCVCVGFTVCRNVFCSRWFVSPFAVQLEILFLLGKNPIHEHIYALNTFCRTSLVYRWDDWINLRFSYSLPAFWLVIWTYVEYITNCLIEI